MIAMETALVEPPPEVGGAYRSSVALQDTRQENNGITNCCTALGLYAYKYLNCVRIMFTVSVYNSLANNKYQQVQSSHRGKVYFQCVALMYLILVLLCSSQGLQWVGTKCHSLFIKLLLHILLWVCVTGPLGFRESSIPVAANSPVSTAETVPVRLWLQEHGTVHLYQTPSYL